MGIMAVTRLEELKLAIAVVMVKQILCLYVSGCLHYPSRKKEFDAVAYFDAVLFT